MLITKYKWAKLNKPARAILPVIGVFINKEGETYIRIDTIMEYAGYKKKTEIIAGIKSLLDLGIITRHKQKKYQNYVYKLSNIAKWKKKRSYFPIDKNEMILNYRWAELSSIEKSLYIVLGLKSTINAPDKPEEDHGLGEVNNISKYCRWAGISRPSFYKAYIGLIKADLIEDWGNGYSNYTIRTPGIFADKNKKGHLKEHKTKKTESEYDHLLKIYRNDI